MDLGNYTTQLKPFFLVPYTGADVFSTCESLA